MAAGDGDAAAAVASRVAARIREIPGDPAIPRAQPGHEYRGVQDDLLVGMGASAARPTDRHRVSAPVPVLSVAGLGLRGLAGPAMAGLPPPRPPSPRRPGG